MIVVVDFSIVTITVISVVVVINHRCRFDGSRDRVDLRHPIVLVVGENCELLEICVSSVRIGVVVEYLMY